jgi:N-methylhydantoinase B
LRSDRQLNPPYGLFGGHPGAPGKIIMNPGTPNERVAPSKFIDKIKRDEVVRVEMPGSGGYGNPLERDVDAVAEDVKQGKISIGKARDVYGVVVDDRTFAVDVKATAKLRAG